MDHQPIIDCLQQLVEDLTKAIGIPCEVVLHDYQDPNHSIVAISGGLTGRTVGGPLTSVALRALRSGGDQENMIGYPSTTKDGKPLRSSTLFLRDANGEIFGSLCINIDLTYWEMLKSFSSTLCETRPLNDSVENGTGRFDVGVPDILRNGVERAIQAIGKPVTLMSRAQKMEVVRILDENGLFLIKGAMDYTAEALGVSRPTIYNYLAENRNADRIACDSTAEPGNGKTQIS